MTKIAYDGHAAEDLKAGMPVSGYFDAKGNFLVQGLKSHPKRVIVLDVDEMGIHPESLRRDAQRCTRDGKLTLDAVADALDSLTPPRPPEPTGPTCVCPSGPDLEGPVAWCDVHGQPSAAYLAGKADAVRDVADQLELIKRGGVTPLRPPEPTGRWAVVGDADDNEWVRRGRGWQNQHGAVVSWQNIPDPIEVLSEGVPERGEITVVDDGRGIDVSAPWWEQCPRPRLDDCGHLDHTYVEGVRYGHKGAGS